MPSFRLAQNLPRDQPQSSSPGMKPPPQSRSIWKNISSLFFPSKLAAMDHLGPSVTVVKTKSRDESRITEFKCSEASCGVKIQLTKLTIGTAQLKMVGDHTHQHVNWLNVIARTPEDHASKKRKPGLTPPVKALSLKQI